MPVSSQFILDDLLQTMNNEIEDSINKLKISKQTQLQTLNNTKQNLACSKIKDVSSITAEDVHSGIELTLSSNILMQKGLSLLSIVNDSNIFYRDHTDSACNKEHYNYVILKSNNKNPNHFTRHKHHTNSRNSKYIQEILELLNKKSKEKTYDQNENLKQCDYTVNTVMNNCGVCNFEKTYFQQNNSTNMSNTATETISTEKMQHQVLCNCSPSPKQSNELPILQITHDDLPFEILICPYCKEPHFNRTENCCCCLRLEPLELTNEIKLSYKKQPNADVSSVVIGSNSELALVLSLLYKQPIQLICFSTPPSSDSSKNVNKSPSKTSSKSVCQKVIDSPSPKQVNKSSSTTFSQNICSNLQKQTKNSLDEFSPKAIPCTCTTATFEKLVNVTTYDSASLKPLKSCLKSPFSPKSSSGTIYQNISSSNLNVTRTCSAENCNKLMSSISLDGKISQINETPSKMSSKSICPNLEKEMKSTAHLCLQKPSTKMIKENPATLSKSIDNNLTEEIGKKKSDRTIFRQVKKKAVSTNCQCISHERLLNETFQEEELKNISKKKPSKELLKFIVKQLEKCIDGTDEKNIEKSKTSKGASLDINKTLVDSNCTTCNEEKLKEISEKKLAKTFPNKIDSEKTNTKISQETNTDFASNNYEPKQHERYSNAISQEKKLEDIPKNKLATNLKKKFDTKETNTMISQETNTNGLSNTYKPKLDKNLLNTTYQEEKLKNSSMPIYEKKLDKILDKLTSQEETIKTTLNNSYKCEHKLDEILLKADLPREVKTESLIKPENSYSKGDKISTEKETDEVSKQVSLRSSSDSERSTKQCNECQYLKESIYSLIKAIISNATKTNSDSFNKSTLSNVSTPFSDLFNNKCICKKKNKKHNFIDETKITNCIRNAQYKKNKDYKVMCSRVKSLDKMLKKNLLEPYLDYLLKEESISLAKQKKKKKSSPNNCYAALSYGCRKPLTRCLIKYLKRDQIFNDTITDYLKILKKTSCSYDPHLFHRL